MGDEIDIDAAIAAGDERDLYRVWDLAGERLTWTGVRERHRQSGAAKQVAVAEQALSEIPAVTALQALQANARLVELLTGRRWFIMQWAREEGASWNEIGAALGMTKQAAHDFYRRKIEEREKYVPDLHDAARARAVLDNE